MATWVKTAGWLLASAIVGAGLGIAMTSQGFPQHRFLDGARQIAQGGKQEGRDAEYRVFRRTYLLRGKLSAIAQAAQAEMPNLIERSQVRSDVHVFVLPRHEGDRIRYAYPPAETLVLLEVPNRGETVVEVNAYSHPLPWDGLSTFLKKTLRI